MKKIYITWCPLLSGANVFMAIFGRVFKKKNPSFKIAMYGRADGWAGRRRASSQVYLLVNLFSKLYVIFILQWIAFIFGRDEEEDQ